MNILIPYHWLLEHLETDATPKEIQQKVSLCGPSIERIYEIEGESVFDIEVTTNRVDAMSIRGIARECAVILSHAGIPAKLRELTITSNPQSTIQLALPKILNDPNYCKRILTVVLSNVHHSPTPDWMVKRLLQTQIGIHDSVIDITNYVTHELGHPCHAFDYDKVMELGGQIIIKEAEKGEKFTTLDGNQYQTVGGELVFENQAGEIIDLPAIKGTLNTAIDANTKNILFWIESVDPKKVRFASMSHSIRTTAAQLNEKNVDPELAMDVLQRGIQLYQELCNAQISSQIFDEFPGKKTSPSIELTKSHIDQYLGITLESKEIVHILNELGCTVLVQDDKTPESLSVLPPSYRPDLQLPADIIEEVARIYGYHNLPSVLMPTPIPLTKPNDSTFLVEQKIRQFLKDIGWFEVYTYSMVSQELAEESGIALTDHLKLQNPLSEDKLYLRTTLIPSLNQVIDQNPNETRLSVFEIAFSYHKHQDSPLPTQHLECGLLSTKPYKELKGDLEVLLKQLQINELVITPVQATTPNTCQIGEIFSQDTYLGTISILNNSRVTVSLKLDNLLKLARFYPTYSPIPNTAEVIEDLTFEVPKNSLIGLIIRDIKSVSSLIQEVSFKDQFNQNFTFTIRYLDREKNLSSSDLGHIRKKIVELLNKNHGLSLVGSLN